MSNEELIMEYWKLVEKYNGKTELAVREIIDKARAEGRDELTKELKKKNSSEFFFESGVRTGRQSALTEKQEQVRKLKAILTAESIDNLTKLGEASEKREEDMYYYLNEGVRFGLNNLNKIFPDVSEKQLRDKRDDCAEQPKPKG